DLGHHMTSRHSGELLHKCTIGECTEAFTEASILKNHLRVFHKGKPHHCSICGEMFDKRMELNRHKEHCKMTSLTVKTWLTESPLMDKHVDEPTDGKTVNDNMESMADNLFEEAIEKEEASWKDSRPKSEKRVANIALSTSRQCLVCSKMFKSKQCLDDHTSSVHNKKGIDPKHTFRCNICSFTSRSLGGLETHMCYHTGERPHKCILDNCSASFSNASLLKQHLREVHQVQPFHCSICGEKFDFFMQLSQHKKEHKMNSIAVEKPVNESHLMEKNEDEAADRTIEKRNMDAMADDLVEEEREKEEKSLNDSRSESEKRVEKDVPSPMMHQCKICSQVFETKLKLAIHTSNIHDKKRAYSGSSMTTNNFPCDLCPHRAKDRDALTVHMRTHTGDRPFKCTICTEGFSSSAFLKQHLREVHKLKPFHCSACGEKFYMFCQLALHKKEHCKKPCQVMDKSINESPLMDENVDKSADRKFVYDNMESVVDDLFQETMEKEESSLNESRSKSETRVE
ncbi:hypothetical protein PENTCL1PPCAC_12477, partial [Pristionchus entomophagus]